MPFDIDFLFYVKSQKLDRCCANFNVEEVIQKPKKKEKKKDKTPKLKITKPKVLSCPLHKNSPYNDYIKLQKPFLLKGCVDTCSTKPWDFASDIIPSEQGRRWQIADRKSGKFKG